MSAVATPWARVACVFLGVSVAQSASAPSQSEFSTDDVWGEVQTNNTVDTYPWAGWRPPLNESGVKDVDTILVEDMWGDWQVVPVVTKPSKETTTVQPPPKPRWFLVSEPPESAPTPQWVWPPAPPTPKRSAVYIGVHSVLSMLITRTRATPSVKVTEQKPSELQQQRQKEAQESVTARPDEDGPIELEGSVCDSPIPFANWLLTHRNYTGRTMTSQEVFASMDADFNGYLDKHEIKRSLGQALSARELAAQFAELDNNDDGRLYFGPQLRSNSGIPDSETVLIHNVLERLAVANNRNNVHGMILDELALHKDMGLAALVYEHSVATAVVLGMVLAALTTATAKWIPAKSSSGVRGRTGAAAFVGKGKKKHASTPKTRAHDAAKKHKKVQRKKPRQGKPVSTHSEGRRRGGSSLQVVPETRRTRDELLTPKDKGVELLSMLVKEPDYLDLNDPSSDPAVIASVRGDQCLLEEQWMPVITPRDRVQKKRAAKQERLQMEAKETGAQNQQSGAGRANQDVAAAVCKPVALGPVQAPRLEFEELEHEDLSQARTEGRERKRSMLSPSAVAARTGGWNNTAVSPGAVFAQLPRTESNSVLAPEGVQRPQAVIPMNAQPAGLEGSYGAEALPTDQQLKLQLYQQQQQQQIYFEQLAEQRRQATAGGHAVIVDDEGGDIDLVTVETVVFIGKYYLVDSGTLEVYDFQDGVNEVVNPESIGYWHPESFSVHFFVPPNWGQAVPVEENMPADGAQKSVSAPISPPSSEASASPPASNADTDSEGEADHGGATAEGPPAGSEAQQRYA
jgi:hypothetical protein